MREETRATGTLQSIKLQYEKSFNSFKKKSLHMNSNARCIITLNEKLEVVDAEVCPIHYTANYLVVTGPALVNGEIIQNALRLEVGFRRSVPYNAFNWKEKGKRNHLEPRVRVPLTEKELLIVLPRIAKILEEIVGVETSSWRDLQPHQLHYGVYRGIFITVSKKDELLYYAFLLRDRVCRDKTFLRHFTSFVRERLKGMKFSNYSAKELKRYKGPRIVADRLPAYTKDQLNTIREMLGNPAKSKDRALFDDICEVFRKKPRREEEYEKEFRRLDKKYGHLRKQISKLLPLTVATHPKRDKRRKEHAKDCYRFEIQPTEQMRYEHSIKKPEVVEEDLTKRLDEEEDRAIAAIPF